MKVKLLLANNEEHLFNILNEKIVWNNNETPSSSINKKQLGLSLVDIEEACKKFFNIASESQEKFLKNPPDYTELLNNKKKSESSQQNIPKIVETKLSNENKNQIVQEMIIENNNEEKNINDNELLCEDEVFL